MAVRSKGVDHAVIAARDLASAAAAYASLGFNITPRTFHPYGTANHLVMFDRQYLELIAVVDPTAVYGIGKMVEQITAQREGPVALAFDSRDAAADHERFRQAGLKPSEIVGFSRPVTLPDGTRTAAEVDVVMLPRDDLPFATLFSCHQKVESAIWVAEWETHANGARGIDAVVVAADDPGSFLALCRRMLEIPDDGAQANVVPTGRGAIQVVSWREAANRYPAGFLPNRSTTPVIAAMRLRTGSLEAAARCLQGSGISFQRSPTGTLQVPASNAVQVLLEFVADLPRLNAQEST